MYVSVRQYPGKDRNKILAANNQEYAYFLRIECQASTQWRKVADRLEEDERCTRLAKADRLDVFQVCFGEDFLFSVKYVSLTKYAHRLSISIN